MTVTPQQPDSPAVPDVQTVSFVSLGCPKNLVDSEKMLGLLAEDGLLPVPPDEEADAIVINTCGFLEASKDESMEEIARAAELKREGKLKRLIVAGCLVQRHRAKMLEWCPDIDALIGVFDRDRIVEAVRGVRQAGKDVGVDLPVYSSIAANATIAKQARQVEAAGYFEDDSARLRLTPRHYAYLRMSEGCNQNCAFCTIPSIRGKMRSKPVDRIVGEARELLGDGAFEINLIGQDTTSYGNDIGYGAGLVGLLESLDAVAREHGGAWMRLMYAYPSCFTDEMIDAIAKLPNILKYIDMPLQHINDRVLDRMRRKTSRGLIETLLTKLRDRVPGIAIRTTFITGFPGETEAEHQELVEFVRTFGFENMGVFPFSPEPGTPAARFYHDGEAIDDETIARRQEELMLAQQEVVFARHAKLAEGQTELDVLIEGEAEMEDEAESVEAGTLHAGRSYTQAPQIDGVTYVLSREGLTPGELVRCRIVDHEDYDLIARPVSDLERKVGLPVVG
ncbi:30S ribosomal protein S12 methylthiotransferase RimO [Phycisphaerales bacterium AB-hyl4]|uniref:Ribosomal protein uS12 methylthiotransferase RimO n=1 Tax=Natronomicrosphaera hydrolytica TaxID=3242702 RepID=A0ABV4U642_9BACT